MGSLDLWGDRRMSRSLLDDVLSVMNEFERSFTPIRNQLQDQRDFAPACDIVEAGDSFVVSFDIPGIKKEDLNIEVSGNRLLISGERKFESEENSGSTHRMERRYGKFQRAFELPEGIAAESIEANYQDGVLKLAIPKAEAKKPVKISIGSGGKGLLKRLTHKNEGAKASNA